VRKDICMSTRKIGSALVILGVLAAIASLLAGYIGLGDRWIEFSQS